MHVVGSSTFIVSFQTELHPLFGNESHPISSFCKLVVQIEEGDQLEFISPIQFGDRDNNQTLTRSLGENSIEIQSPYLVTDLCVWFSCYPNPQFLVSPNYICTQAKASSVHNELAVFSIFPILSSSSSHQVGPAVHGMYQFPLEYYGLAIACWIFVRFLLTTTSAITRGSTGNEWMLLGTFPELQENGKYLQSPARPVPFTSFLNDQEDPVLDADNDNICFLKTEYSEEEELFLKRRHEFL